MGISLRRPAKKLIQEIEEKRELLYQQMELYQDISHPQVLKLSQELDLLLNQFNELTVDPHGRRSKIKKY